MIKLIKGDAPAYLSEEKVKELIGRYEATNKSVWLRKGITNPLKITSHGKCAYCEKRVDGNGSYMEVDHFKCKGKYSELVVDWSNLVPSCKQCNTKKGDIDVEEQQIVNPYFDNPSEHLRYQSLRIVGITEKGNETVELFGYNLSDVDARKARLIILEKIDDMLGKGIEYHELYINFEKKKKIYLTRAKNVISGLLSLCQPDAEYSAITSTLLLLNPKCSQLIENMRSEGVWDLSTEDRLKIAIESSFPVIRDEYSLVKLAS
ncbi:HNH endonuclease [Aeromonas veronii]|uniref:HNH endonuclease n=1 Tax=Aeromonas veronii TaxID=654 RepID=UPI003004E996